MTCSSMLRSRKRQRESGVDADLRFTRDRPAETFHNRLAKAETDTRTVCSLARRIEAFEDSSEILWRDAGTGVFDDDRIGGSAIRHQTNLQIPFAGLVHVV